MVISGYTGSCGVREPTENLVYILLSLAVAFPVTAKHKKSLFCPDLLLFAFKPHIPSLFHKACVAFIPFLNLYRCSGDAHAGENSLPPRCHRAVSTTYFPLLFLIYESRLFFFRSLINGSA